MTTTQLLNVTDDDAPCIRIVFPLVLLLVRDPVPLTASAPPSRTSLEGRIAGLSMTNGRLGATAGCGSGAAGGGAGSSVADSDDAGDSGEPAASS